MESRNKKNENLNERITIFDPIIDKIDMIRGKGKYSDEDKAKEKRIKAADDKAKLKKLRETLKFLIRTKDVKNIILALEVARGQNISLDLIFGKIFEGIDFSGKDLRGIDFSRINLKKANFSNANLQNCKFLLNNLEGADFSGANLQNAHLLQSKSENTRTNRSIINNTNFRGCNLYKARLKGRFINCDFKDALLAEVVASYCYFKGCNFENADLLNTNVDRSSFNTCNFKYASLYGMNFKDIRTITRSDFTQAEYTTDDVKGLTKKKAKTAKNLKLENNMNLNEWTDNYIQSLNENNLVEELNTLLEKNVPTNPSKWSYYKSQAKKKFDVYPSAYANAWAAKKYKAAGGGWKKESVNEQEGKVHTISAKGVEFQPKDIVINVGDTIEWKNVEGVHNVNGKQSHRLNKDNPESFGNKVGKGWTYKFTFTKSGKYNYHCDPHLGMDMVATVTVKESVDESMDKSQRFQIYNKLKKGDKVRIKYGSSIRRDNEGVFVVSKGKTVVGRAKVERIILKNIKNPRGVKYYLYNRDNNITMATGDMGAVINDMEIVNESVKENMKLNESMLKFVRDEASSGMIAGVTGLSKYKDIDTARGLMIQILKKKNLKYSLGEFEKLGKQVGDFLSGERKFESSKPSDRNKKTAKKHSKKTRRAKDKKLTKGELELTNEGIGTIALGVVGGYLLLKTLKFVFKKAYRGIGMNVKLSSDNLHTIKDKVFKQLLKKAEDDPTKKVKLLSFFDTAKEQIENLIDSGKITTVKQLQNELEKIVKLASKNEPTNEAYVVLYSPKKGQKPVTTSAYADKKDAEKWATELKKDGGVTMIVQKKIKGIDESVNEESYGMKMARKRIKGVGLTSKDYKETDYGYEAKDYDTAVKIRMELEDEGFGVVVKGNKVYWMSESVNEAKKDVSFSKQQLDTLRKGYATIKRIDPTQQAYKKITDLLDGLSKKGLEQLTNANINFISALARNRLKNFYSESVNEANDYFNTASQAVDYARKMIEKRGFEIDEDDWNTSIVQGGKYNRLRPGVGKTHSYSIGLLKNGKPQRKELQISLYGMPSGKYELTYYVN